MSTINPPQQPVDSKLYKYFVPFALAVALFVLFSIYLYLRRGFYDLYIINKILAGVAAVQLGIVLLLGPLGRIFDKYDSLLKFRKYFGIVAFLMALLHSVISFFFLSDHFPIMKYFTPINVPFIFGLLGVLLLTILFLISNEKTKQLLTPQRWWRMQYIGVRIAFIVVALHVFIMKYSGWISWYQEGGSSKLVHPEWPGLGMLVGFFILYVVMVRLSEAISTKLGMYFMYAGTPVLIGIYIVTFIWGIQFA